jgi:hypothetical protein
MHCWKIYTEFAFKQNMYQHSDIKEKENKSSTRLASFLNSDLDLSAIDGKHWLASHLSNRSSLQSCNAGKRTHQRKWEKEIET